MYSTSKSVKLIESYKDDLLMREISPGFVQILTDEILIERNVLFSKCPYYSANNPLIGPITLLIGTMNRV